jgi:hypothetical protein
MDDPGCRISIGAEHLFFEARLEKYLSYLFIENFHEKEFPSPCQEEGQG